MELEGCIRSIDVEAMLVESQGSDEEPLPPAASQSRWGARPGVLAVMAASVGLAVIATRAWATRAPSAIAATIQVAEFTQLTSGGPQEDLARARARAMDYYAAVPCQGDSQNILGSEPQAGEDACMLTCTDMAECMFVAYCPETEHGCHGPQKNNCVRYRSCETLDSNYRGYTTQRKVSAQETRDRSRVPPSSLHGWVYSAPFPCQGDWYNNILGSEPQPSLGDCMLECGQFVNCMFVSYCTETDPGCQGPQKNKCVRYSSCETLDFNHVGYRTHKKKASWPNDS